MSESSSTGWPSPDRADDERLAWALAEAEDAEVLLQLLDRYAARLYDYCHALLRDQEEAAGALHDALLSAYMHVGRLHDRSAFRAWLYALVRNECLRRIQDPGRPAERNEAPEVEDLWLDAQDRARLLETRRLVHAAMADLRGRERESLDLLLRHGLDAAEIAAVTGMSVQQAGELSEQARYRLDDTLAALVVAHDGRADCPSLAALTEYGQGPMPPPVIRKVVRHLQHCATCSERRHRTVSTARMLQALPVALMPGDLRGQILTTATDPAYLGELEYIAAAAEPFDELGWPLPRDRRGQGAERPRGGPPRLWPAIAAAAAVMILAAGAFLVFPGGSEGPTSAQGPASTSAAPDPSDPAVVTPTETSPTPTPTTSSPTSTPTPTPTPTRSARRDPSPSAPELTGSPDSPKKGRLVVGPNDCGSMSPGRTSCTIGIRAVGGPVTWSSSGSGGVSASDGGTLAAGAGDTVTATRPQCGESGSGVVSFSSGDSVGVSWTCPADPDAEPAN